MAAGVAMSGKGIVAEQLACPTKCTYRSPIGRLSSSCFMRPSKGKRNRHTLFNLAYLYLNLSRTHLVYIPHFCNSTNMPLASFLPIELFNMYPKTLYVDTSAQANLGNENVSRSLYTSAVGDQRQICKAGIGKPTTILRSSGSSKVLDAQVLFDRYLIFHQSSGA